VPGPNRERARVAFRADQARANDIGGIVVDISFLVVVWSTSDNIAAGFGLSHVDIWCRRGAPGLSRWLCGWGIGASMLRVEFIGLGAISHEHVLGILGQLRCRDRRGMLSRRVCLLSLAPEMKAFSRSALCLPRGDARERAP
jgi:hypothetical protein